LGGEVVPEKVDCRKTARENLDRLWVLGQRLRGLCGSVFFKVCAMDGARSEAVFFETRRHGEHRGGGLWGLGQRLRGLCGSVFFKVCAMDGVRSDAVF
jgi:hypothetical protein